MKLKKVRKLCMVKGCRNVDCYTLTACREFGQSVIMCGTCIKAAAKELERMEGLPSSALEQTPPSGGGLEGALGAAETKTAAKKGKKK